MRIIHINKYYINNNLKNQISYSKLLKLEQIINYKHLLLFHKINISMLYKNSKILQYN